MQPIVLVAIIAFSVLSVNNAAGQGSANSAAAGAPGFWQPGVLCGPSSSTAQQPTQCNTKKASLLQKYSALLSEAAKAPVVTTRSGSTTFMLLGRYLKPNEANIQFAQAYCVSKGGQLAYWTNAEEYTALTKAALKQAADTKAVWHFYTGLVQQPGAEEPRGGWTWIHNNTPAAASLPWAKGEPNQHNSGNIKGHTEDCGVIATYHGQKATQLVDDFPCNYGASNGKYLANGYNPKLSVACRLQ